MILTRNKELLLRGLAFIILYPLMIVLLRLGPWTTLAMAVLAGVIGMIEWFNMITKAKTLPQSVSFLLIGNAYIFLGAFLFWFLYLKLGWLVMALLLTATIISDTGAYIFGSLLKGPKLAPAISPNKTWSGAFGGVVSTILFGLILGQEYMIKINLIPEIHWTIFLGLISLTAQLGDLLESWAKRKLNTKDSSHLIPGHGGILDRIDSILAVVYFISLLMVLQIV